MADKKGNFTLPGEAGYEALTLELAERWGADVIRDSDGTKLSPEILDAGYDIYSTVCVIREHNPWLREHPETRQETFLSTKNRMATSDELRIDLLEDFYTEQFEIDDRPQALDYWEVYDRTTNTLLAKEAWNYDAKQGAVHIQTEPWHEYSVSFLAWRIWEEISMYNHVTNNWTKEHLMQLNPYLPQAQDYLRCWMRTWCEEHEDTNVVRFTSLFYNFAWIWGSDERNRNLFTDWASYDFTVCPEALDDFEKLYGYRLYAEDFVNKGRYQATHRIPTPAKKDWMDFISGFVRKFGRELVDIVHEFGKKAYVFYDDSWVGLEPYNGTFEEFNFDGLIKCVFSGFEVRLCGNVPVETHELRFHPYLFPVGLGGAATFSEGGQPEIDAKEYWISTRRALLRQKIDRCGLGGYLHLVEDYPLFVEAMDEILAEFREISALHDGGKVAQHKPVVGILTSWGKLRSWTLSGHFHETYMHTLIHVIESLAGLAFDVRFLSFDDVKDGIPADLDVIINAGEAGDAWSGGEAWKDSKIVSRMHQWVHDGGCFLAFEEASVTEGYSHNMRMSQVLGVDIDDGSYSCHGKRSFDLSELASLIPEGYKHADAKQSIRLLNDQVQVLLAEEEDAKITLHNFGKGMGIYLSAFAYSAEASHLLEQLILYSVKRETSHEMQSDNAKVDVAVFPENRRLIFVNNSAEEQNVRTRFQAKTYEASLLPYAMKSIEL